MDKKNAFGNHLRELRLNRGLTQADVQEKTGYTQTVISQYETGNRFPSSEALEILAGIYRVSVQSILLKRPNNHRARVMRELEGMTDKQLDMVWGFIRDNIGTVD